jgi:BCD family chlorophyll transporter-like MFS transporter
MSTLPSSPSPVLVPPEPGSPRSLKLPEMFRLGLFQMGLGIMSVLTLGVLNRVMIGELGIPATIAAGTIALHQFVAPARVWFGQLSDTRPLFGLHRTGYVWLGAGVFSTVAFLAVQAMWRLGDAAAAGWQWTPATLLWTGVLGGLFAVYGLALSSSSTPFAALLVDVSDEGDRPRLVGIVWSMLMVGIVIGAIATGILLGQVETASAITVVQGKINGLFAIVPLVVMGLTVAATLGMERRFSRYGQRTRTALREDQINLGRAIAILTSSRQTAIFFSFLVAMTAGLFMQEAVLEPYGAEVFDMPIAATTQLNAFFGMGTLLGLSGTGFAIAPRLGKTLTTKVGCLAVAACFVLIIAAGYSGDQTLLKTCVGLFGFASGVATTGAISLMLDLTVAETAGTFIGAWGVAQALSRAVSTVLGGAILDLGKVIFKADLVAAYGLVFASQIGALLLAVYLLQRVNVRQFQRDTDTRLSTILEADLD